MNRTEVGLALEDRGQYNVAGAMTSFGRRDTLGGVITNTYSCNGLYQITNQTVTLGGTTLQKSRRRRWLWDRWTRSEGVVRGCVPAG